MMGTERLRRNNLRKILKLTRVQWWNLGTSVLVFLFMLYLNISVRYCTDDWHYEFVYFDFLPDAGVRKMLTFQDILLSIRNYYQINGGRILANGTIFCVLMADQWVFDLVNTGMFTLMGLLVYKLVPDEGWRKHAFSLPLIYFCMMYFSFSFGDSVLWLSGAINYLWTGTLNLWTVYLFQKYAREPACKFRQLMTMAFFMFLAGQSNETTGGMLLILITLLGLSCGKERKIDRRLYAVSVPAILCGMAIVILAPGNLNRAHEIHGMESFGLLRAKDYILYYVIELLDKAWPICLLCLFVFSLQARKGNFLKAFCAHRFFWAGTAGFAALGIAGVAILRGTFLPVVYLILAGCDSLEYLIKKCRSIEEEGRLEELVEKKRLTGLVLRMIGVLACMVILYLVSNLLLWGLDFTEKDFLFLARGAALMVLLALLPVLPNRRQYTEKLLRCWKKIWIPCVVLFAGVYLFSNMAVFQENKRKQWELEKQVLESVTAKEGEQVFVSFPMYQDSEIWPIESGSSPDYAIPWMKEYFRYETSELGK